MPDIVRTMCVASASELIQQSDLYMTVKAVLFTTPSANLNGVRCTEGFIDEIVANQDAYIGLPLNADIRSLESGQYNKLGHMFDQTTGTFATAIIGSFYKFEKTILPSGDVALIGYARIMKRNQAVCSAIAELFATGNLKFSFEISCGEYSTLNDGTMLIDASKDNYLEGMCIVWSPACPEAVAKELVAELTNDRKEAEDMHDESAELTVEVAEVTEQEAEEKVAEVQTEPESNLAETADKAEENVETQAECQCEDKKEEEAEAASKEEKEECAEEAEPEKAEEVKAEAEVAEAESGENEVHNEVAAESNEELKNIIAELMQSVNDIKAEIAELKAVKKEVVASVEPEAVNGFMDTISIPENKYSLLERDSGFETYTLLEVD